MKTIMVSGKNFKCSLEIDIEDDLIPKCQMFLGMMMKFTEATFYSNRVPEVSKKIGKIIKEELAISRKSLTEEQKMKILVLVGVYKGIAEDVEVFKEEDRDKMKKAKKQMMNDYEIKKGHEEDAENHIEVFEKEI